MKKLTPKQKEVLRRLLYEDLIIVRDFSGYTYLCEMWKWSGQGDVNSRTFESLFYAKMIERQEKTDSGETYYCYCISNEGVRAAADRTIVEKAIKLLSPGAEKFKPREEKYYFEAIDENDNCIDEFDPGDVRFVCEKCVEEVRGELQGQVDSDVVFGVPENATILAEQDTFSEVEGFCYCDKCGAIIVSSTLPSEEEVDYWLDETGKECFLDYRSPLDCYQLTGVLEWHTDDPAFTPRIEKIARLLVDGAEKKKIKGERSHEEKNTERSCVKQGNDCKPG